MLIEILVQEALQAKVLFEYLVAETDDLLGSLERHTAVLSNPSAPEAALEVSEDALLTVKSMRGKLLDDGKRLWLRRKKMQAQHLPMVKW